MSNPTEAQRIAASRHLRLLDSAPCEVFDRFTRTASQIFRLPMAAISLADLDCQRFRSALGMSHPYIPRDGAPCAQVTATNDVVVVADLQADDRYRDGPLARSGARFYAGAPLTNRDGLALGAICVLGHEPRAASASELASLQDLAAMAMGQIELQHTLARVDPISGLANRLQFFEDLEELAQQDDDPQTRLAVMVDLASPEQFSHASRVMGSAYVDDMIREAVMALRSGIDVTRKNYHVGTCQFAYLAPPATEAAGYIALLAKILGAVRSSTKAGYVGTTAIGVAPIRPGQIAPGDVLRRIQSAADDARSKQSGVSLYSRSQDIAHRRRFKLLSEFDAALQAPDQLRLEYQPRIDLVSGACDGAEALLRWDHPGLGAVSPGEFIPLVERTAMARPMTGWVLDTVLSQIAAWRAFGLDLRISVNVSASNLLEHDLAERVVQGLASRALPASCLELEITETAIMSDASQSLIALGGLAKAGIALAIDDFGTGYSSLAYLQRLPTTTVKIDQSFMRQLAGDLGRRSLVSAMISLSHELGYRVVAEGIESRPDLDIIKQAGCDEAQGFFFGRPMPPEQFAVWARDWNATPRAPPTSFRLKETRALTAELVR